MRLLLFLLAFCCSLSGITQGTTPTKTSKPSSSLLSRKDTLYLTIEKGEKIIHHTVKPKQTLFGICKFYSLSLEELYEFNPQFQTDPILRVGDYVRIPTPNIAIKRYKKAGFKAAENVPLCYVVQHGDNLYQICKRHFEMPVDTIKLRNKLKSNNIVPGQVIHMGWVGIEGFPLAWRAGRKPTENDALKKNYDQQKNKHKEVVSQGICMWNKDNSEIGDLYALHREAALGTIICVTNPANKKTVFAKVIGRIPQNYGKNAEVVISPAAARKISATSGEFMTRVVFLK